MLYNNIILYILFLQTLLYMDPDSKDTEEHTNKCKDKIKGNDEPSYQHASNSDDDNECKSIINSHDYYKILGVGKECTNDEIKKAYKKKAIKFHPDKNSSPYAEEAFKKIATAYQTLSDPDKRKKFDLYGSEEEFREKYYQEHQRQYEDDIELDPFDLFQMFMGGGLDRASIERLRRQRRNNAKYREQNPKMAKLYSLLQLLPIIMMFALYILPGLFERKELFAFNQSFEYPYGRMTNDNKVVYFVGNGFIDKYKYENENTLHKFEREIEKKYLTYLYETCNEQQQMKRQLEYQMKYYRTDSLYYNYYLRELNSVNMKSCDLYSKLRNNIK